MSFSMSFERIPCSAAPILVSGRKRSRFERGGFATVFENSLFAGNCVRRRHKRRSQMKHRNPKSMLLVAATAAIATFWSQPLRGEVIEKVAKVADTTVHYKVVLPDGYDPAKAYPAILAMGGGPQNMNTVDGILSRNFRAEAEKRGYIVVAPAAPDGDLFFEDGDRIFPDFLKMLLADYKIQDNKFHVAGPSNGGIASLHVAATNPEYFLSVTAFPGYMWEPDEEKLQAISKMKRE